MKNFLSLYIPLEEIYVMSASYSKSNTDSAVVNGGVCVKAHCFFGSNATSKQAIVVDNFVKAGSLVK